jgi:hypothetical protein
MADDGLAALATLTVASTLGGQYGVLTLFRLCNTEPGGDEILDERRMRGERRAAASPGTKLSAAMPIFCVLCL